MSASPPSWTGSDEDLEMCFLLDVDGLGEEEEGLAPAEVAPDAPDDTCQWEEFMSSANTVNDKLVVFQAAIASAVASASLLELNSVTAKGVPASASALALGADTEPKIPLEEDCSADSDTDAVTRHSAVSSVLEDMLRSLEQLWETMAAACVCPPAPVEHTVESAEGRSHLIIIDDADDPPLSTTAHMVQIDANETVADRVKLIHEMNRLALEVCLDFNNVFDSPLCALSRPEHLKGRA